MTQCSVPGLLTHDQKKKYTFAILNYQVCSNLAYSNRKPICFHFILLLSYILLYFLIFCILDALGSGDMWIGQGLSPQGTANS